MSLPGLCTIPTFYEVNEELIQTQPGAHLFCQLYGCLSFSRTGTCQASHLLSCSFLWPVSIWTGCAFWGILE